MAITIGSSSSASAAGVGAETQGKIERLLAQIKVLNKKIRDVQKQLMDTDNLEVKKILMQEIDSLGKFVQSIEQQILQLQIADMQKKAMKERAELQHAIQQQKAAQRR
jgi:hypothetical protein